jgi:hypothetical protein
MSFNKQNLRWHIFGRTEPSIIISLPIRVYIHNNSGLFSSKYIYLYLHIYGPVAYVPHKASVGSFNEDTNQSTKKNCCNDDIKMEMCRKRLQALLFIFLVCFAVGTQCKLRTRHVSFSCSFSTIHLTGHWLVRQNFNGMLVRIIL